MSAAAHLPCLRYSAPRFFNVVVTVGLKQNGTIGFVALQHFTACTAMREV